MSADQSPRPTTGLAAGAVRRLVDEHDLTRRALAVLRSLAERVESGGPFPSEDVALLLRYFREFVEQEHHPRESRVLYPFAAMLGGDHSAESVGELLAEHDESRTLLRSLWVFWEPTGILDAERRPFAELARTYATRLDRHMRHEENDLFPIVRAAPGDEWLDVAGEFASTLCSRNPDASSGGDSLVTWTREIVGLEARHLL